MLGILLVFIGCLFFEAAGAIGKYEIIHHRENIFTLAFLNNFFILLFFSVMVLTHDNFIFSWDSLPFLLAGLVVDILQVTFAGLAISQADHSTMGFLRMGTVPLLLIIDYCLGYDIAPLQFLGIGMIIATIYILYKKHGFTRKGVWWVLASTVNAAIGITLYKYNITHFNSVEEQQHMIHACLIIYLIFASIFFNKTNPFKLLTKGIFLVQATGTGIGALFDSFFYLYAPASIITAAKRSVSAFFTIVFGTLYFHEHKFITKMIALGFLVSGIIMLAVE